MFNNDIKEVHIFIMGFRQNWRVMSGVEKLWKVFRSQSCENIWILPPFEWNQDWNKVAELITRHTDAKSKIYIYSFSFGGGWGFPKLAKELKRYKRNVEKAVSSDPIYRNPIWPEWFWGTVDSLFPKQKIKIEDNVKEVSYTKQNIDEWLKGHDFVAMDKNKTKIHDPKMVTGLHHNDMDEPELNNAFLIQALGEINVK